MSYKIKGMPWSSGIGVKVEDCATAREVMEKAGLNFTVDKCELVARMPFSINGNNVVSELMGDFAYKGNIYRPCPNAYATFRTDTSIPLGLVKSKYEVVQNIDAFNFFDDAIGKDKAVWQTAGMFGYGERIFVSAKLPITTTVKGDPIENYLVFSNSHDGSSSVNILFTPIRVFCTNCLQAAFHSADSYLRIKHTKTAKDRLTIGAELLASAIKQAETAKELYESLYAIKLTDKQVLEYLGNLVLNDAEQIALKQYDEKRGYEKIAYRDYLTMERTGISTRKANRIYTLFDYYQNGIAQQNIVGTAWGAYNAVTGFYSNVDNTQGEKRMDSLLYGGASNVMTRALNNVVMINAA